jgi:hypothetical protein
MSIARFLCMSIVTLWACGKSGHDPERYVLTGNEPNIFFQTDYEIVKHLEGAL